MERAPMIQYIIVLSLCSVMSVSIKRFEGKNVKVIDGIEGCISNCSRMSFKKNRWIPCSVRECNKPLPSARKSPQAPEIEDNVYLEIFTDEHTGEIKLALKVEWSPVDNVSLEQTTGYVIDISGGTSSYTTCYVLGTELDFHASTKDIMYNDCFGKVNGTEVIPDSIIHVSIASLPLWSADTEDSKTAFEVKVPDCGDRQIKTLSYCVSLREKSENPPTSASCATNCNTYSVVDGTVYPIECSLSQPDINNRNRPESCVPVNRTVVGTPTKPQHVKRDLEWYTFIDPKDKRVKLALNFSWAPVYTSGIRSLEGYYMEILDTGVAGTAGYDKCFSIHNELEESKHAGAQFFYDCYGRDSMSTVLPNHEYLVHINSRPRSPSDNQYEAFKIEIPNCVDPSMQSVTQCIEKKKSRLEGKVEQIMCHNRSMKYTYFVSPDYGDYASVIFCERGPNLQYCKNLLSASEQLNLSNTLYNISLPSSANLSVNYTIWVQGNRYSERDAAYPDFSACVTATVHGANSAILISIFILAVLIVIGLVILLWICYRDKLDIVKRFSRCRKRENTGEANHRTQENALQETDGMKHHTNPQPNTDESLGLQPLGPAVLPAGLRVYVVFMDDHDLHKKVVHWFCCYLQQDLSLDVRISIWENNLAAANSIMYMTNNLEKAEKVIIICSAGTRMCLDREYQGDMFTPVVRQIIQKSFVGKSPGKFLVGYFDYSSPKDVPEFLYDQTLMYFSLFKFMKQFEQFYFRLVGIEQYQEGGIQRIEKIAFDRYYDPALTTCGPKLKEAIDEMTKFVKENPTWYTDQEGEDMAAVDLPPSPSEAQPPSSFPSLEPTEQVASILHLSHPEIPETGARRKIANVPQNQRRQVAAPMPNSGQLRNVQTRGVPTAYPHVGPVSQTTVGSEDESFMVSETETEDFSYNSSQPWPSRRIRPSHPSEHADDFSGSISTQHGPYEQADSFHPATFNHLNDPISHQSEVNEDMDSLLTDMPSNETQITRLGFPEQNELPKLPEAANLISIEMDGEEEDVRVDPESGVFSITLANIDECEGDIEDEFKSINLLV